MRARIELVCTWAVLVLGAGHLLAAPVAKAAREVGLAWFSSTGVALVMLGLLNLARRAAPTRAITLLCFVGNVLGTGMAVMLVVARATPAGVLIAGTVVALTVAALPAPHLLLAPAARRR